MSFHEKLLVREKQYMKDELNYIFAKLMGDIHKYIGHQLDKQNLSMFDKSLLGECGLTLKETLKCDFLVAHERVITQRNYSRIFNIVYSEESLYYFSSFYYAYRTVKDGDYNSINLRFKKINLDALAMILRIKSIEDGESDLGSSTDNYFFTRMENCTWAFKYVLNNLLEEYFIPSLYCICNLIQTLMLYNKTGKNKYEDKIEPLINMLYSILNEFIKSKEVRDITKHNVKLNLFIDRQLKDISSLTGDEFEFEYSIDEFENLGTEDLLRVLTSLVDVELDLFNQIFVSKINYFDSEVDNMNMTSKLLMLRVCSMYYTYNELDLYEELECGIFEKFDSINTDRFLNQVFNFSNIDITSVTEAHVQELHGLKDDELRIKFSNTINGVNPAILNREARKPHGAHEISDMEVPIRFNGDSVYLCLPFKSGVEISGSSVPVQVSYQIVRPFIEFENCVVIFVTAKRCSEYLMNYIKKLRDSLQWPIEVIEDKALAALLVLHEQL